MPVPGHSSAVRRWQARSTSSPSYVNKSGLRLSHVSTSANNVRSQLIHSAYVYHRKFVGGT
eukprot:6185572-Pleurochrysis_carterae.AAC.2